MFSLQASLKGFIMPPTQCTDEQSDIQTVRKRQNMWEIFSITIQNVYLKCHCYKAKWNDKKSFWAFSALSSSQFSHGQTSSRGRRAMQFSVLTTHLCDKDNIHHGLSNYKIGFQATNLKIHEQLPVYWCKIGWPYFDYRKPGHSARQWDTQIMFEVYSKMPY